MRVPKPRRSPFIVVERPAEKAARFVTIGPDDPVWSLRLRTQELDVAELVRNAFVRVRPPPDVPDDVLQAVLASLRVVARRVTGGVRPRTAVLPAPMRDQASVGGPRDVVVGLVRDAHTRDRAALAALCERVMVEAKL